MKLSLLVVLSAFFVLTTNAQRDHGLNYNYYEGSWSTLPNFHALTPVKMGNTSSVDIGVRGRNDHYGIVWYGSIDIPASGNYTFEISSDDGSKFYLADYGFNKAPLISNDGVHGNKASSATTYLDAGNYPVTIIYFQNDGPQAMDVYWSSNTGISRQKIPSSAFNFYSSAGAVSSKGGALNYSVYEGTWNNLPNFSSLSPVKTGTTSNIDLGVSGRTAYYGIVWQGTINVPTEANYTFETVSDDGSKIAISDGTSTWQVVNNDGTHGNQSKSGVIYLRPGLYNITITYFQKDGPQSMEVYWSSDHGIARQKIPDNIFSETSVPVVNTPIVSIPSPDVPEVTEPSEPSESGGLTGKTNYYFSSSNGDDSRTSNQAQNPATPWRTLGKLNAIFSSLKAGDAVLFNRGETFDGSVNLTASGNSPNPIIISSYGNGPKPIFNGLATMTNWVSVGNGVWESSCPSADGVNMVTLNGVSVAMGRYPNITEPNKGYLSLEDHNGNSSITDYQLSGNTNWTGAEAVIRKNYWVLDRCLITYHSGNTLYLNSPSNHDSRNGYGYFIQNSPQTLDQLGEWYFDPSQKKLKMYFGSNNPYSFDVKASVVDQLLSVSNRYNILVDNIYFRGADDIAISIEGCENIRVQNCEFRFSGGRVIEGRNTGSISIENSNFNYTNNEGILLNNCWNSTVKNNRIKNTGLLPGMGQSNDGGYQAIHMGGANNTVELNRIDSTGYSGMSFSGDNVLIKNNVINYFTLTKDDGAGIYTWGDLYKYNRKIVGNIIMNGLGAPEGVAGLSSAGASGISLDDNSANVEMIDNTVYNCNRSGIFIHNSHEVTLTGNTLYNNNMQLNLDHDVISPNNPIRNLAISNNILFSKKPSQLVMFNQSLTEDFNSFGWFDNNYYTRPLAENGIINTFTKGQFSEVYRWYDIEGWAAAYGYDVHSKRSPVKMPAYTVNNLIGSNKFKNGDFNSDASGLFCLGNCGISWNWGKLDGGALQLGSYSFTTSSIGGYMDIGAVNAGSKYLVKFTSMGSYTGRTMRAYVMKNGGSYDMLTENQYVDISPGRSENEFLFTSSITAPAAFLIFTVMEQDCPIWIDNLKVYEANATVINTDEYFRFEYNPTTSTKTVSLDATYYDVKNNRYSGNINLAPFTSLVLMKQSSSSADEQTTSSAALRTTATAVETVEASSVLDVSVSPNPAKDRVQIVLKAPNTSQKATLSINTMAGVTLKTFAVTSPTQSITVDISTWSKGVYFVNLVYDGKVVNQKFVKQ